MSKRWTGIWMALISGAAAVLLVHGVVHAASGRSEQPSAPAAEVIRFQLSADKLYSAVMQGSRNESYYELRTLKKLSGESLLRQHGHTEGWAEVDGTILSAEQALQAGAADGTLLDAASRLRLAADSLTMGIGRYGSNTSRCCWRMPGRWSLHGHLGESRAARPLMPG